MEKENLMFEVLELSMPPALNESGRFQANKEWEYKVRNNSQESFCIVNIDVSPASTDRRSLRYGRRIEK